MSLICTFLSCFLMSINLKIVLDINVLQNTFKFHFFNVHISILKKREGEILVKDHRNIKGHMSLVAGS